MVAEKSTAYITGMGALSPYGKGVDTLWDGLLSGKNAFRDITLFDASPFRNSLAGEVEDYEENSGCSRAVSFLLDAVSEALSSAGIENLEGRNVAFCLGSNFGGISSCIAEAGKLQEENGKKQAIDLSHSLLSEVENALRKEYVFAGNVEVLSLSCASGTAAIGTALDRIRSRRADIVIAGGFDELSEYSYAGLSSLRAISKSIIKPFHKNRDGTIFSEGAGVLVLESANSVKERDIKPFAEVVGVGINNDAFHITAPEKEGKGICRVMQMALADGQISKDDIRYINCHATGTKYNDIVETRAIKQLFTDKAYGMVFSANKSNFGHAMGAAGGLEAIATVMSLKEGVIPPTLELDEPDPELDLNYCALSPYEIKGLSSALSCSYGLGGTNASIILRNFK